jgi:hypothetical protein
MFRLDFIPQSHYDLLYNVNSTSLHREYDWELSTASSNLEYPETVLSAQDRGFNAILLRWHRRRHEKHLAPPKT